MSTSPSTATTGKEDSIAAPSSLKVLLIGSGGREHALAHSISKSPLLNTLYAHPGNPGILSLPSTLPLPTQSTTLSNEEILQLCKQLSITFVVVGPEVPLVDGLCDKLREQGIIAFGPSGEASQLEGSKVFSKCFLERHKIPTAEFAAFQDASFAKAYARELGLPLVIKASGLAAGKGVILIHEQDDIDKAMDTIDDMLINKSFGEASDEIIIEKLLIGEEVSFFALVEHTDNDEAPKVIPLVSAQDHKKLGEGDIGLNTGGMGAYSPSLLCNSNDMINKIMNDIVKPTVNGMKEEGYPFSGILYCGLMINTKHNSISVLEYNVRFGDPECQCLVTRLKSDLLEILYRASCGKLGDFEIRWDDKDAAASMVVVLATKGYPGDYKKGSVIKGLDEAESIDGVTVFQAGTKSSENGEIVSDGGRVLGVTGVGKNIEDAKNKAYEGVDAIQWDDGFCRRDIGWRAISITSSVPEKSIESVGYQ